MNSESEKSLWAFTPQAWFSRSRLIHGHMNMRAAVGRHGKLRAIGRHRNVRAVVNGAGRVMMVMNGAGRQQGDQSRQSQSGFHVIPFMKVKKPGRKPRQGRANHA